MIKCVIVDDEPLALNMVSKFIEKTHFLELVGAFDNAIDALTFIESNRIQLLFLDIQMADLTGMELARILAKNENTNKPLIIFTTAYSEFALEGYQVDAIDYILKPFDYDDFLTSASKARKRLSNKNFATETIPKKYIFIKAESQIIRVEIEKILYIKGLKDYVKIYLDNGQTLISLMSLKKLEDKLTNNDFLRIHRSYIISFAKVDALLKASVKIGDTIIPVGATHKIEYDKYVNQWIK